MSTLSFPSHPPVVFSANPSRLALVPADLPVLLTGLGALSLQLPEIGGIGWFILAFACTGMHQKEGNCAAPVVPTALVLGLMSFWPVGDWAGTGTSGLLFLAMRAHVLSMLALLVAGNFGLSLWRRAEAEWQKGLCLAAGAAAVWAAFGGSSLPLSLLGGLLLAGSLQLAQRRS